MRKPLASVVFLTTIMIAASVWADYLPIDVCAVDVCKNFTIQFFI